MGGDIPNLQKFLKTGRGNKLTITYSGFERLSVPQYITVIKNALKEAYVGWEQNGDDSFYVEINHSQGPIAITAQIVIDMPNKIFALFDIAIYPKHANFPIGAARSEIREALSDFRDLIRKQGYSVEITGERVSNSSSARPGHKVHLKL